MFQMCAFFLYWVRNGRIEESILLNPATINNNLHHIQQLYSKWISTPLFRNEQGQKWNLLEVTEKEKE